MGKIVWMLCITLAFAFLFSGCYKQFKAKEATLEQPINCATAEGDIRVLQQEKVHVKEQIKAGVMSIMPPALIGGLIAGTAKTKAQIAVGDYNKLLDMKIQEIKDVCGVE
jgi:hypothetical protein